MKRRKNKAPLLDADSTMPQYTLRTIGQCWKFERHDSTPVPLIAKLFWSRRRINSR
jgi:hypothetical protein